MVEIYVCGLLSGIFCHSIFYSIKVMCASLLKSAVAGFDAERMESREAISRLLRLISFMHWTINYVISRIDLFLSKWFGEGNVQT